MNIFGHNFRLAIWGESHGQQIGISIDGIPAGVPLSAEDFETDLARRRSGARGTTPRREPDIPQIVSGLYNGMTTGAPLTIEFANRDTHSQDYANVMRHYRPSHADMVAYHKFNGFNDPRQQTGARRQRWMELIDQYYGKIDLEVVKKMLADTYDVSLGYNCPSSRDICAHYDVDPQYYADDPDAVWNIPFYPAGSCDAKAAGPDDVKHLKMWGRYGRADGVEFVAKGSIVKQSGWRGVYREESEEVILPEWNEGDILPIRGCSLTEGKTKPKPFHTEATLLAAMETAGKEVEDEEMRQAMKDCGIGTPATRAAIIETLLKREYIVRSKKVLVPTEKGLALYSIVRGMNIANVEMTGEWEAALAKIERGELPAEAFMRDIEAYTRKITTELLACDKIFGHKDSGCCCPKCGNGNMQFYGKVVRCDNAECALPVFRQIAGKTLSDAEMTELLKNGQTKLLNGFRSKQGKPFSAIVAFDSEFNTVFEFPEEKKKSGRTGRKRK